MYESSSRVQLGELDSGAGIWLISPQTHELTPNFATHTRTSLAHWNPSRVDSRARLLRVWAPLHFKGYCNDTPYTKDFTSGFWFFLLRPSSDLWSWLRVRVRVRVTLRLAVYRHSVRLGDNPLRPTTRIFIFQLNSCCYSPYVTFSLTRGLVCLYSCCWSSPAQ
jgi:hypothetical protein